MTSTPRTAPVDGEPVTVLTALRNRFERLKVMTCGVSYTSAANVAPVMSA